VAARNGGSVSRFLAPDAGAANGITPTALGTPMASATTLEGPASTEAIVAALREGGPAVVALSGGVDSAVVAAFAVEALGAQARAVTITGPAVSSSEVDRAREAARHLGIAHELLALDPLSDVRYAANPSNRCYFCRQHEMGALRAWGTERGAQSFLDGVHLDDLGDDRPGIVAMDEAGFTHPLLIARWRKADVRAEGRRRGLPHWDAPSDACLASRIPHGTAISLPMLRQVERAEAAIRPLGFARVRVRSDGRTARVEVEPAEVRRLLEPGVSREVRARLAALGLADVVLDPAGYHGRRSE
jgi:pyridinium-3,5-biscarboxylic acid mononucleotide sulfurtransferase